MRRALSLLPPNQVQAVRRRGIVKPVYLSSKEQEIRKVNVVVDEELRGRLRLVGKYRRRRLFLKEVDEVSVREAIRAEVPALRQIEFELDFSAAPDKVRVHAPVFEENVQVGPKEEKKVKEVKAYQTLSWYCFFDQEVEAENVEDMILQLRSVWTPLGILGRAYVATEGINAQLAVPVESMSLYRSSHTQFFQDLLERNGTKLAQPEKNLAPMLNLDLEIPIHEYRKLPPFRALHLRQREKIVTDAIETPDLDLSDAGREISPEEWHETLPDAKLLLDVRNHYESAVGSFTNSIPLDTETFKDTNTKLNQVLHDKPRDQPVFMYCTGGIRCVKAGAYVKQQLGFSDVRRLQGGIVNYTSSLKQQNQTKVDLDDVSRFRGINFVFNDRMGEVVTKDTPKIAKVLDARAAEAVALARQHTKVSTPYMLDNDGVYEYAAKMSGEEPNVLRIARLDAIARFPHAAHMVCGPTQGKSMKLLCEMSGAKRALELGTFCGYGALWLASALKGNQARVVTVDRDPRSAEVAQTHFASAALEHPDWAPIDFVLSDTAKFLTKQNLQKYEQPFDFVVLDADKKGYAAALDALFEANLLRPGSLVLADNTLWKGAVLGLDSAGAAHSTEYWIEREESARQEARELALSLGEDPDLAERQAKAKIKAERRDRELLQAMHEFNIKIRRHPRLDQVLLPIRDGLTLARVIY